VRTARVMTICLAALLAMAIGPAWASAAPESIVDDNLATGTTDSNIHEFGGDIWSTAIQWENQGFDAGVPGTWTAVPWAAGGTVTQNGNGLDVDGARVGTNAAFDGPKSVKFDGTFSGDDFQNMGLGTDFNAAPWAMFSTGGPGGPTNDLYARTQVGTQVKDELLAGVSPTTYHDYDIRWTTNQVRFYVDGTLVSTHDVTLPDGQLHFLASDANVGGGKVFLDGIKIVSYLPAGTFTSRVLDAGPSVGSWGALTATGNLDGVTFETRSGDTAEPDASWSSWQAVGAGGQIQSPARRYIQYAATLDSLGGVYEDRLNTVTVAYDTDATAPTAVLDGVSVSGTTATASFSSPDSDVARFECKLDGGAYATCTSPKAFAGLAAGGHTISVRAVDNATNVGAAVSRAFTIAAQPGGGGTTGGGTTGGPTVLGTTETGTTTVDRSAPKVVLSPRSVRASRAGKVAFRVKCPRTEQRCKIAVELKRGGKVLARKTVSIGGGKTVKVTLRLNKAARRYLSTHARLRVTAVTVARDAAGNRSTKRVRVTVSAPRR
jgi:hypothetical protein